MKKIVSFIIIALVSMNCFAQNSTANAGKTKGIALEEKLENGLYAKMATTKGEILIQLEFEKTPMTVANFSGLAEGKIKNSAKGEGEPYYDGIVFHRVIDNFMIQGGDPTGTGRGGPGYNFSDEFDASLRHNSAGILSMANAGPGTNGSQFFITHNATPHLDDKHTVFGSVVKGQDVVNAIVKGDKIESVKIIRVGESAEKFKNDDAAFKALIANAGKAKDQKREEALKIKLAEVEKKYPDTKETESGLKYIVKEAGQGESPTPGAQVSVHYEGTFLNGSIFDSSIKRGKPIEFPVGKGQVIAGWDEALLSMKKGEKRTLIIPPDLAYGSRGFAGVIPPDAWLVFEVELVDFK